MPEPLKSMPGEGITGETIANSGNIAYDKNDYNSKDGTVLTSTRYICSP
jgi:hypothetical protein